MPQSGGRHRRGHQSLPNSPQDEERLIGELANRPEPRMPDQAASTESRRVTTSTEVPRALRFSLVIRF